MTTAPTPPSEYPQHDERSSYSNLEVANHIEGQPYHYVPYSEAVKDMDKSSAMAAEYYLNPPLFAQNPSVEEKILSPGDSVAPEVSPHPYGHAPEVAAQGYPYHYRGHAQQEHGDFPHQRQDKPGAPVICGIRRKTFWIVLGVVAAVVLAAAVGGGVGGYFANRSKDDTPRPGNDSANTTDTNTAVTYRMSIAALKWEDPKSHYRVYLQPAYKNDTQILESAWDSDTQRWSLTSITKLYTDIKPNAPLAAVAGIPHSDPVNERMNVNVYYPLQNNTMIELTSPYLRKIGDWGPNGFTENNFGFTGDSSMAAYMWQDMDPGYFILAVLYQERGANSLTIKRYAEGGPAVNVTQRLYWDGSPTKHPSIMDGSPLAPAPRSDAPLVMLYMADVDGNMKQLPIDLRTNEFEEARSVGYKLAPHNPLCVATEDNRNLFTDSTLPSCFGTDPLTHLILFADEDRQDLKLVSWNCSSGFVDATSRIKGLLKPKRTYLSLATTSASNLTFVDHRAYVLYDEGKGPKLDEWKIPDSGGKGQTSGQGGNWNLMGEVPIASGA